MDLIKQNQSNDCSPVEQIGLWSRTLPVRGDIQAAARLIPILSEVAFSLGVKTTGLELFNALWM